MKLFRLAIVVIAAILAVMSLILMRAAPWLGFILLLMAIVVVIAVLVAGQPKKHSNQRITREGVDMGTMMYRFDGSKVLLSVKLEEMLAAGIGIPDDAIPLLLECRALLEQVIEITATKKSPHPGR